VEDWHAGEELIGLAEKLVHVETRGDRDLHDLWKRGAKIPAGLPRDDPRVARAYAARDRVRVYFALMEAMVDLAGLRALGRAVLFLQWRVLREPQPQQRLLREAAKLGISETTLERAKRRLRMESVRKGGIAGAGRWYVRRGTPEPEQPPTPKPKRGQMDLPL